MEPSSSTATAGLDCRIPGGRGKVKRGRPWLRVTCKERQWESTWKTKLWKKLRRKPKYVRPRLAKLLKKDQSELQGFICYLSTNFGQFNGNVQSWRFGSQNHHRLTWERLSIPVHMTVEHLSYRGTRQTSVSLPARVSLAYHKNWRQVETASLNRKNSYFYAIFINNLIHVKMDCTFKVLYPRYVRGVRVRVVP